MTSDQAAAAVFLESLLDAASDGGMSFSKTDVEEIALSYEVECIVTLGDGRAFRVLSEEVPS